MTVFPLNDSPEAALAMMLRARRLEEAAAELYGFGLAEGDLRLSIGQEAAAIGLRRALRPGDGLFVGPRSIAHASAAGLPPADILRDVMDGGARCCDRAAGFDVAQEGASPVRRATGFALAGGVAVAVLDDEDAQAGASLDAWRSAAKTRLLVVIEDAREVAAPLFGFESALSVDAGDHRAVSEAVAAALAAIEVEGAAQALVLRVARYRGWSMGEPDRRRESRPRAGKDGPALERARLLAGGFDEEAPEAIDAAARRAARSALTEARARPAA